MATRECVQQPHIKSMKTMRLPMALTMVVALVAALVLWSMKGPKDRENRNYYTSSIVFFSISLIGFVGLLVCVFVPNLLRKSCQ